jgi:hypothetical protein
VPSKIVLGGKPLRRRLRPCNGGKPEQSLLSVSVGWAVAVAGALSSVTATSARTTDPSFSREL